MADEKKLTSEELTDEQANKASGGDGVIFDPTGTGGFVFDPTGTVGFGTSGNNTHFCGWCKVPREGKFYKYGRECICEWCAKDVEARNNIKLEPVTP